MILSHLCAYGLGLVVGVYLGRNHWAKFLHRLPKQGERVHLIKDAHGYTTRTVKADQDGITICLEDYYDGF